MKQLMKYFGSGILACVFVSVCVRKRGRAEEVSFLDGHARTFVVVNHSCEDLKSCWDHVGEQI